MWTYTKNIRPFTAVCDNSFGRQVIYTHAKKITSSNLGKELEKALVKHQQNRSEILYLDRYYRGDQPILYRKKKVRSDINNRIVENHAYELVESKTAELVGEPIQYVLRGSDQSKSEMIKTLNDYMESEDKSESDIELCRWRSICGTSYRFVPNDMGKSNPMDETPFAIRVEDPGETFVCYYSSNGLPAYSCQTRYDEDDKPYYIVYTNTECFEVKDNKVKKIGDNGNYAIPVIEYPNNERRLSDIEITILLTDSLNTMQSDRVNGMEQFVQALMKFKNCEIDKDKFLEMVGLGAVVVKDTGSGQSDVSMMTSELNQSQTQIAKEDTYNNFLLIQGKSGRQENSGGDTGSAVQLRNGHYDAEKRAELSEPIFKRSERQFLRLVLNRLRILGIMDLKISDVEIKITRSRTDNMLVKAEVLQILLNAGIEESRAVKTVNLWSDPEEVSIESRERFDRIYHAENNPNSSSNVSDDTVNTQSDLIGVNLA